MRPPPRSPRTSRTATWSPGMAPPVLDGGMNTSSPEASAGSGRTNPKPSRCSAIRPSISPAPRAPGAWPRAAAAPRAGASGARAPACNSNMCRRSRSLPSRTRSCSSRRSVARSPPRTFSVRSNCLSVTRRSGASSRWVRMSWRVSMARLGGHRLSLAPLHQPGALQRVQVAVEHAVDVAHLQLGAGVLAHLVGLQHVAADLAAEVNVELGVLHLARLRPLLFQLMLVQTGAQNLHRHVLVLVLAALVLALHHDVGRQVDDAHRRVGHVDMLSALAAGAEGVNAQILVADVDLDAVVNLRADEHAGKRGVPPLGLIEGRDAHQPVHARLRLQQSVGVLALDGQGGALDARLFALLAVIDHHPETVPLGPARVHAQQHLRPVLALGAARAVMDGKDGVQRVVFPAQQGARFDPLQPGAQPVQLAPQIALDRLPLPRQLEQGFEVLQTAPQRGIVVEQLLHPLPRPVHRLRARRIVPESGFARLGVECRQLPLQPRRVKDTPGYRGPFRPPPASRAAARPSPWQSYDSNCQP